VTSSNVQIMNNETSKNFDLIRFPLCSSILQKEIDQNGFLVLSLFENKPNDLMLFNKCINLNDFINETI